MCYRIVDHFYNPSLFFHTSKIVLPLILKEDKYLVIKIKC